MLLFLKKLFMWFGLYLIAAVVILYFVVYNREPGSFLRLWTDSQYAIIIACILAGITNFIFYYPAARGAAVCAIHEQGKTYEYAIQAFLVARAVAILYWIIAGVSVVVDSFARWSFERDMRLYGQSYAGALPALNLGLYHYGAILVVGAFLTGVALFYGISHKHVVIN